MHYCGCLVYEYPDDNPRVSFAPTRNTAHTRSSIRVWGLHIDREICATRLALSNLCRERETEKGKTRTAESRNGREREREREREEE
jgi:hypothetical protein